MQISLNPTSHVLFIGDSITDCGRVSLLRPLGDGFVSLIGRRLKKMIPSCRITNRGVSGDRVADMASRWKEDCIEVKPTTVSILIGINDTWRKYDQGMETSVEEFEEHIRDTLNRTVTGLGADLVICEPFLLPMSDEQKLWSIDLNPKRRLLRGLAEEYGAVFVPLHEKFLKATAISGASMLVTDGVHPTRKGHELIASAWLEKVADEVCAYS
ncbi:MAG: SGNH/GDSL hydrolase family protein [Chitinispirillaceae bacterium]|nr:SGNH/GDSL hydrolase family protein [Chitinispirillaceae bacterium]